MLTELETKMEFASKAENINLVEKLIDEIREQYLLSEDVYGNMIVAVTEAVTNAIHHGNKLNPLKTVTLKCDYKDDTIVFLITDQGPGFNQYNLPDPTAPENLEKPHGRGIFLMKHLTDQIIFSDEGRTVELCFKLTESPVEN